MKTFSDDSLKTEINEFNFGTVLAGDSKEQTFWIKNDAKVETVDIKIVIDSPEVAVVESPTSLQPGEVAKVILRWVPSIAYKSGLKAQFQIRSFDVYKPNDKWL